MALLGTFIDVRTLATFASGGSASFAHGLPATPDMVIITQTANATNSSASIPQFAYNADATNVSVYNVGQGSGSNNPRVMSIVAHSVIR